MNTEPDDPFQQTLDCVFDFIQSYKQEHGISPTQREIGAACHISKSAVSRYLDRLEIQGHISREIGLARSIRILKSQ